MATANAILIYEEDSQIMQRFCPEAEAREYLDKARSEMRGGSMFATDGMEAELVLSVSPQLRDLIAETKTKLQADTRLRDALDRHGVPVDRDLRLSIYKALEDMKQGI